MRRTLAALVFAVPLVACASRDVPIVPEPLPEVERAVPVPSVRPPSQGGPEVAIPAASNGVLPPGAADKVLAAGAAPIVRLLDPGAEPRSDLSYTLTKGTSQNVSMATDMAMSVRSGGQGIPQVPLPRMTMIFAAATADRSPAGEFKIDSRVTGATVDPTGAQQEQMAKALRPQIEAMKGLGLVYWVNPKGNVRDLKLDVPSTVPPTAQQLMSGMSQSFEWMVTPLPQEPVGVGARWQVVKRLTTGGLDVLESAVYTLKSRSGARATVDVSIVQLAASDTLHTPQMPAGMFATVKSFKSSGSRTTQVDLKSVAPEGGTASLKTGMEITLQDDQSAVETTTNVQVARP